MTLVSKTDALAVARFSKEPAEGIENLPTVELVQCEECRLQTYCKVAQMLGEGGYCSKGEAKE